MNMCASFIFCIYTCLSSLSCWWNRFLLNYACFPVCGPSVNHSLIGYIEVDHDSSPLSFQDSDLLTFNISAHHSWWSEHGPGCVRREIPASGERSADTQSYISIMGCLLEYQYIEVLHSSFQILISVSRSKTHTQTNYMSRHVEKLKHSISFPSVVQKPCFYYSLWSPHTIFTLTICVYILLLYLAQLKSSHNTHFFPDTLPSYWCFFMTVWENVACISTLNQFLKTTLV